jgi:hypothetical protein
MAFRLEQEYNNVAYWSAKEGEMAVEFVEQAKQRIEAIKNQLEEAKAAMGPHAGPEVVEKGKSLS